MSSADVSPRAPGDEALIASNRRGGKEAFGELVALHEDRVYGLAYRLTGNRDDAAEVAQEAFLKAWRAFGSFRGDSSFYTWLFRITVNTARSRQRFRAVRPNEISLDAVPVDNEDDRQSLSRRLAADGEDPVDAVARDEHRKLVEQAIGRLNRDQRMLIVLRDIEGRNYKEISDLLDCPRGTVKSRLHRARMALRDLLAPMFGGSLSVIE